MSGQVRRNAHNPLSSLHHFGLIKILICYEFEPKNDAWIAFLENNCCGFSNQPIDATPQIDSLPENDEEERLSDEDNCPLDDLLQKKGHSKKNATEVE